MHTSVEPGFRRSVTDRLIMEFEVPRLTDKVLGHLYARIRPVVTQDDRLYYIERNHPREVAFTWDPVIEYEARDLIRIGSIPTLHTYGYYGAFKPSVAEVMAMIPHTVINYVRAFEVHGPEVATDLNDTQAIIEGGHHLALTTLFA